MTWDEVFDRAEKILGDKASVRQARVLNQEGRAEDAVRKLVDAVVSERRRLMAYSASGKVVSGIVALDHLRCKICNKNVVMSVKEVFPTIRQCLSDAIFLSRVIEPVARTVENASIPIPGGGAIEGRPVAELMRIAAKAVGAGWSIWKNKNGARDVLKKVCGAVSAAVGSYANAFVDRGRQLVGCGSGLFGRTIQAVHDECRKAIEIVERGTQTVKEWCKKLVGVLR